MTFKQNYLDKKVLFSVKYKLKPFLDKLYFYLNFKKECDNIIVCRSLIAKKQNQ